MVRTGEVKTTQVGTCIDLTSCYTDELRTTADGLEHRFIGIDIRVLLVHIADLHGLAHRERTLVSFLGPDDHTEEGSLTGTVRTDHSHNSVRR